MSRWPDPAARAALRAYRTAPLGDRLHVLVRWFELPVPPVVEELPDAGRVLEVGCGHGLFSRYLAERSPGLHVHGVDIDADKIAVATASGPLADGRLDFAVGDSGAVRRVRGTPSSSWTSSTSSTGRPSGSC